MLLNPSCTSMFLCRIFIYFCWRIYFIFSFNTLKMLIHCFLVSSTLFLQISFFFFLFSRFFLCVWFLAVIPKWPMLDGTRSIHGYVIRSKCNLNVKEYKKCHVCFQHPYYHYLYKTDTCQLFCISKKNIPLSEKIILILFPPFSSI